MISLRNRLIAIIFSTLFISISGVTFFTFHYVQEEFTEVMDGSLKQLAVSVSANAPTAENKNLIYTNRLEQEGEFIIQLWDYDNLIYSSHPLIDVGFQDSPGFGNTSYNFGQLRYYQYPRNGKTIQVFQSFDERQDMLQDMQRYFILPIIAACPVFLILIYVAIGKGLKPLSLISNRVRERDGSNLSTIDIKDVPEEISSLVQSLNQLFYRLEETVLLQRRFTSDAAHELRTPLTAIKLQLDMLRRAADQEERTEIEASLHSAAERSTKLVENLLMLARHETDALSVGVEKTNLSTIAKTAIGAVEALAIDKNQTISFEDRTKTAAIDADTSNMHVVIENLLQNAIAYTPEDGKIRLSLEQNKNSIVLCVQDNGKGIKVEERSRVFDRFYRCQGTKQMGSGLGLSIVKNIVEYYKGQIEVSGGIDGLGTSFTLTFPKSVL